MTLAILNHMPWWAGALIAGALAAGYFLSAWLTREDVEAGRRRYKWLWW